MVNATFAPRQAATAAPLSVRVVDREHSWRALASTVISSAARSIPCANSPRKSDCYEGPVLYMSSRLSPPIRLTVSLRRTVSYVPDFSMAKMRLEHLICSFFGGVHKY